MERIWAKIFREAGARVQENVMLRDICLPGVSVTDCKQIETEATGLPVCSGVQAAVDSTCVGPLRADGRPWNRADIEPELSIARAEAQKKATYSELVDSPSVRLLTLACETGGRWSDTCAEVVRWLAAARPRSAPQYLQVSARRTYEARWWALLSIVQQDALAGTLTDDSLATLDGHDDAELSLGDLILSTGRM